MSSHAPSSSWSVICAAAVVIAVVIVATEPPDGHGATHPDLRATPSPTRRPPTRPAPTVPSEVRSQPAAFVENQGQWSIPASHVAQFGPMTVFIEERGWCFTLVEQSRNLADHQNPGTRRGGARARSAPRGGIGIRMRFDGDSSPATPLPERRLQGVHHYFLGNDPARWRTDVPRHAALRLAGLYPGIDVRARGEGQHFEYDLLVAPGADLEQVVIEVQGASALHRDAGGSLIMETALGPICQKPPPTWQIEPDGSRRPLRCHFTLRTATSFGFAAPERDAALPLVVDPGLIYATYLGGSNIDGAEAIATDSSGASTLFGITYSPTFPTTPGAWDPTLGGNLDTFVTRLDLAGSGLLYSTFIGGSGDEILESSNGVVVDAAGAATIGGRTASSDFPTTTGAFDTTANGAFDGFVVRLHPLGSSLVFATLIGGSDEDAVYAVAIDGSGVPTIAGATLSLDFPTTAGAYDTTFSGGPLFDVFVARLDSFGSSLSYSTLLGEGGDDFAHSLAIDGSGDAVICGQTSGPTFPTTPGAFATTITGMNDDAFVARLNAGGSALVYSTLFGGSGPDAAVDLVLGPSGTTTICGFTWSSDIPTTPGAFDTTFNGGSGDAFLARFDPSGGSLLYASFLGGSSGDSARVLAIGSSGATTLSGWTGSTDFPTTPGAHDTAHNGGNDGFVLRLDPAGTSLIYSTFLGGSASDMIRDISVLPDQAATVCGGTDSTDFPATASAYSGALSGGLDAFVARLDMLPTGTNLLGSSTAGCNGLLPIGVTAMPQVGAANFAVTCSDAAIFATGVLGVSDVALAAPQIVLGAQVWIDLASPLFWFLPVGSNGVGAVTVPLPLPANPALAGAQAFAQFAWPDPCAPGGMATSSALQVTIQ